MEWEQKSKPKPQPQALETRRRPWYVIFNPLFIISIGYLQLELLTENYDYEANHNNKSTDRETISDKREEKDKRGQTTKHCFVICALGSRRVAAHLEPQVCLFF